ncbi:Hsp20 family protein [Cohnella sp. CFH 77786]|uniref:Hsp20/alpha crystallin family protein n=1 Tax=Cohnella sp. CFH 77786 TaxID=2662265 RepID=UPI001C60D6E8|nr:Hsp20/alpha crystallin family protein [Cohnella sp. CFH 77786]MBW5444940.1 Hsp20 family protein [Cohnella sp. CFH 77786]
MNPDKINKWLELAKNLTGNDFWSDMFEQPRPQQPAGPAVPEGGSIPNGGSWRFPAADVLASDREIVVLIDLPGVEKEDIQLAVGDETLYVKGEAKPLFPGYSPVSAERFTGSFERPIGLPARIDGQASQIRASFHQGTLIVRIPVAAAWKKTISID